MAVPQVGQQAFKWNLSIPKFMPMLSWVGNRSSSMRHAKRLKARHAWCKPGHAVSQDCRCAMICGQRTGVRTAIVYSYPAPAGD